MIQEIFKDVLSMSFSSAFLIAAVIVARFVLQKSSKHFRKLLWGLVAFRLVIPFSFESSFSLIPQQGSYIPSGGVGGVTTQGSSAVAGNTVDSVSTVASYVWVVVFLALAVYGAVSFLKLKLKINDSVRLRENIYQSEKVESPFVFGIIKPKIYMPYKIEGETLDYVLAHERTHIKYLDHITKLFGFMLLCIHWFNPLVWVAYLLFCKDTELACDEAVVKNMTEEERKNYARALCDIGINKVRISACPVAFGEVSLKARVKSAIRYKKIGKIAVILSLAVCIIVAMCFMTSPENPNAVVKADAVVEARLTSYDGSHTDETNNVPVEEILVVEVSEPKKEEPIPNNSANTSEETSENTYNEINLSGYSYENAVAQAEIRNAYERAEFEKRQQLYQSQNNNNNSNNNSNVISWDLASDSSKYGSYDNTPSVGSQAFENNNWVGWNY